MPRMLSIGSASALWLIECVRRRGEPVRPLLELVGIDPKAPPPADQHLTAERYLQLWERGTALVPSAVAFPHAAPKDLSAYREVLGVDPAFGADWCGFEADRA